MGQPQLLRVFQEHEGDLRAFMAARLRCPFTAHDLSQELYLKISAAETRLEVANARAYLFRMAANLVIDYQRRQQRQASLLGEVEALLWGGRDAVTPERQAMARQELRALAAEVERLPPATRRVFKRNRFDGRTQREIAEELGISQTAVEKHVRKALSRLAARRRKG